MNALKIMQTGLFLLKQCKLFYFIVFFKKQFPSLVEYTLIKSVILKLSS